MRFKLLLSVLLATTACSGLPFPGMFGGSSNTKQTSSTTSTNKTEESHTINGHPVDRDGNREDIEPAPKKKKTADAAPASKGKQRGATCHHNEDCASDVCFTGRGDLGYCTQMCDDDMSCPGFWECKHVGNAPQRICMQEKD